MAKFSNAFGSVTFQQTAVGTAPATTGLYYLVGATNTLMSKVSEVYMGGEAPTSSTPASMAFGRVTTAVGALGTAVASVQTDVMSNAPAATSVPNGYTTWTTTGPAMAATAILLRLSFNAYGGIVRWVSSPDQQITMTGTGAYSAQGAGGQLMLQQVTSTGGVNALISGHVLFEVM